MPRTKNSDGEQVVEGTPPTIEETKLELWEYCLTQGWIRRHQPEGMNCLYNNKIAPRNRMRLNFQPDVLRLETKQDMKWVVLNQSPYDRVQIGQGGLLFNANTQREPGKGA